MPAIFILYSPFSYFYFNPNKICTNCLQINYLFILVIFLSLFLFPSINMLVSYKNYQGLLCNIY